MSEAPKRIYLDGDVEAGDGMFPRCFENPKYASEPQVEYVRADRIEELEAEVKSMAMDCLVAKGQAADAYQAQLKAEAKLAKAVDALERMVALHDDYSPFGGELLEDRVERTWQKARTTLAELTGGKDE